MKTILFYSSSSGAGRSMACANVATLLAWSGRRVSVLDATDGRLHGYLRAQWGTAHLASHYHPKMSSDVCIISSLGSVSADSDVTVINAAPGSVGWGRVDAVVAVVSPETGDPRYCAAALSGFAKRGVPVLPFATRRRGAWEHELNRDWLTSVVDAFQDLNPDAQSIVDQCGTQESPFWAFKHAALAVELDHPRRLGSMSAGYDALCRRIVDLL